MAASVAPDDPEYRAALCEHFPFKAYIDSTERRALSCAQLDSILAYVTEHCGEWHDRAPPQYSRTSGQTLSMDVLNLYHTNDWLIKPSTEADNCAFVELLADGDQPPDWFVSHWWGERIRDFVTCVRKFMQVRYTGPDRCKKCARNIAQGAMCAHVAVWVCAYANRQHSLAQEVTADPRDTSFFKALRLAVGVLVILDDKTEVSGPATAFSRIWCGFEEFTAVTDRDREAPLLLDIAAASEGEAHVISDGPAGRDNLVAWRAWEDKGKRELAFPVEVLKYGFGIEIEKAQASVESDRTHILNCIIGRSAGELDLPPMEAHGSYTMVNRALRSKFAYAAWLGAMRAGKLEEWDLPGLLAADTTRTSFVMKFPTETKAGKDGFKTNDQSLALLGKAFAPWVVKVELDFTYCLGIRGKGVVDLCSKIPQGVKDLTLSFMYCSIGNVGAHGVGAGIPLAAEHVDLCFTFNTNIESSGLSGLAEGLGRATSIRTLKLNFERCERIGDPGISALGQALANMPALERLVMNFHNCAAITDAGIAGLFGGLPASLKALEADLRLASATDAGAAALKVNAPPGLEKLKVTIGHNKDSKAKEPLYKFDSPQELAGWTGEAPPAAPAEPGRPPPNLQWEEIDKERERVAQVQKAFHRCDSSGSGMISLDELFCTLRDLYPDLAEDRLKAVVEAADTNKDGAIDYHEFIAKEFCVAGGKFDKELPVQVLPGTQDMSGAQSAHSARCCQVS